MTVRVSKPEFNLREKLSELDKPVGIHGNEVLKSDSLEETCAIVGSGRRNLVINGGFEIWQRGLSNNSFNSSRWTADRWLQYAAGNSILTVTRQQFTTGQTEVPGNPKYYYRMDNTPDPDQTWLELFHRIVSLLVVLLITHTYFIVSSTIVTRLLGVGQCHVYYFVLCIV